VRGCSSSVLLLAHTGLALHGLLHLVRGRCEAGGGVLLLLLQLLCVLLLHKAQLLLCCLQLLPKLANELLVRVGRLGGLGGALLCCLQLLRQRLLLRRPLLPCRVQLCQRRGGPGCLRLRVRGTCRLHGLHNAALL
jgi:hypothetical protein